MQQRKGYQRIVLVFLLLVTLIMGGFLIYFQNRAVTAERLLSYQQLKHVDDLTNYLENIESALLKTVYAGDQEVVSELTAKLWREAGFAKESLAAIPTAGLYLEGTYQFLSQVGEYAKSLSQQETITEEERQTLLQLRDYANTFLTQLLISQDGLRTGNISATNLAAALPAEGEEPDTFVDGFLSFEEGFTAYPTLIYDGPFSDHLLQQTPKTTQGFVKLSVEEAKKQAAEMLSVSVDQLVQLDDENGNMPAYCFQADTRVIALTMHGGFLCYLIDYQPVTEERMTVEVCEQVAYDFLKKQGLDSMQTTYYEKAGGLITFNFAYTTSDITHYTDLVKVSVSLDKGTVVRYDARGYLINHHERVFETPTISIEEAQQQLSPLLQVNEVGLALIPSDGMTELLCYEFSCTTDTGEQILVYVNTVTGREEQLLILYIDENGTLTI